MITASPAGSGASAVSDLRGMGLWTAVMDIILGIVMTSDGLSMNMLDYGGGVVGLLG